MRLRNNKPFNIVRHAETTANLDALACGWLDSPLTERGGIQAQALGRLLCVHFPSPVEIFHSALTRTRETARIAASILGNASLKEVAGLNEHSFGEWEGKEWRQVLEWLENGQSPPGGESRETYVARVISALDGILDTCGENPVIVAHGGTFFALARAYGLYPKDVGNCEIIRFEPWATGELLPWKTFTYDRVSSLKMETDIFITT